ncbi:tetratricopeptide repeat protein [Pseudomonas sp. C2B4]|uniref:tetratricopeptide repeat protein n=1 Tax=Pseudomonas sp. C2B4 TaxID=2735270 RepID=UPI001585F5AF|nr:hypothetical protein [Pseudomonas sp. C2B4]NUU38175.1 hypothetical protein [Pseudomonas sp. C2B4]
MREIIFSVLLFWSALALGKNLNYSLSPDFVGANKVEFIAVGDEVGEVLKGSLIDGGGRRYKIPDVCEPEGGNAELSDAYVVKGKKTYFLFTCAWSIQHSGLGIKGVQYETFVYTGSNLAAIEKNDALSQALSGYEGSLEGGESSYAWYVSRKIASKKLLDLEVGEPKDSLALAHDIVLARLKNEDYEAVSSYLGSERINQLDVDFPVSKSTVVAYNDFGYALGRSGENDLAYKVLKKVEKVSPGRVVLKLNIADVLWGFDKEQSRIYYKEYVGLMKKAGKEKLIPEEVLERSE